MSGLAEVQGVTMLSRRSHVRCLFRGSLSWLILRPASGWWTSAAAQDLAMADTRSRCHHAFRIVPTTPSGAV
jgi:hypothetical protein